MIRTALRPKRKSGVHLRSEAFPLSQAKTYLGRLVDKAAAGETVYIIKGHRKFILQPVPDIDPIPMRPPGYFAEIYSKEEIAKDNQRAKVSVVRPPKDLE